MKITYICTCHNEIEYLPYVVDYYLAHGIEVYIIDNYSTDGTWEWLEKRDLPRARGDADKGLIKSDWVIYGNAGEFIIGIDKPIEQCIHEADRMGFNSIKCRKLEFHNTGEELPKDDPRRHFFYYREGSGVTQIHKHKLDVEQKSCLVNVVILNYGTTKLGQHQKELSDIRAFEPVWGHIRD